MWRRNQSVMMCKLCFIDNQSHTIVRLVAYIKTDYVIFDEKHLFEIRVFFPTREIEKKFRRLRLV